MLRFCVFAYLCSSASHYRQKSRRQKKTKALNDISISIKATGGGVLHRLVKFKKLANLAIMVGCVKKAIIVEG